jgi:hypothetical protein
LIHIVLHLLLILPAETTWLHAQQQSGALCALCGCAWVSDTNGLLHRMV